MALSCTYARVLGDHRSRKATTPILKSEKCVFSFERRCSLLVALVLCFVDMGEAKNEGSLISEQAIKTQLYLRKQVQDKQTLSLEQYEKSKVKWLQLDPPQSSLEIVRVVKLGDVEQNQERSLQTGPSQLVTCPPSRAQCTFPKDTVTRFGTPEGYENLFKSWQEAQLVFDWMKVRAPFS